MPRVRFSARIEQIGVNPFVWIGSDLALSLAPGRKGPIPVIVRVNGRPTAGWRVNAMPAGDGSFRLYLNGIVRDASQTSVGDFVGLEVSHDGDYRGGPAHPMPVAFRRGLAANATARAAWSELPPSRKKEILRYLASLKGRESRRRNIDVALAALAGTRRRFLGRDWSTPDDGTRARKKRGAPSHPRATG